MKLDERKAGEVASTEFVRFVTFGGACKYNMDDCLWRDTNKCNNCTDRSNYEWDWNWHNEF